MSWRTRIAGVAEGRAVVGHEEDGPSRAEDPSCLRGGRSTFRCQGHDEQVTSFDRRGRKYATWRMVVLGIIVMNHGE